LTVIASKRAGASRSEVDMERIVLAHIIEINRLLTQPL